MDSNESKKTGSPSPNAIRQNGTGSRPQMVRTDQPGLCSKQTEQDRSCFVFLSMKEFFVDIEQIGGYNRIR